MAPDTFRIRKHDTVGAAAAEEDKAFLDACFVSTGDLDLLKDTANPKRILLGRTGTGKTATLMRLSCEVEHAIRLEPASLSLQYLSNNNILRFFEEEGVKLDLFYQLLWKHIFAVELIKARYKITSADTAKANLWDRFAGLFARDKNKDKALDYLRCWGNTIWEDPEYRVKEIVTNFETQLQASVSADLHLIRGGTGGSSTLSEQQKAEFIKRGREVVNAIQIKRLSDVITFLAEDVFEDRQNRFYVIIDRLDERWVEDELRYNSN